MTQKEILDGTVFLLEDYERIGEAMDIWGKQQAIEFFKWMNDYVNYSSKKEEYGTWKYGVPEVFYTINELYELFIQSKKQK